MCHFPCSELSMTPFLFGLAHQDDLYIKWGERKGGGNNLNTVLTYEMLRKITKQNRFI